MFARSARSLIAGLVLALVAVACKDQGPPGPNFIARNEGPEAARLVVTSGTDTIFDRTIAVAGKECATLDARASVNGTVLLSADTLALASFWAAAGNNWADIVVLRAGPEILQTHTSRNGC